MKRKLATLMAMLVLTAVPTVSAFASSDISLQIDGKTITSETKPFIEDGNTLVPIRLISENLDCKVDWDANSKTVTITKDSTTLKLVLNSQTATVNGKSVALSAPAKSVNGSTYVPVRFVSENMDCTVGWDANTKTVTVNSGGTTASTPTTSVAPTTSSSSENSLYERTNPVPYTSVSGIEEIPSNWESLSQDEKVTIDPLWRPNYVQPEGLTPLPIQYGDHITRTALVPESELANKPVTLSFPTVSTSSSYMTQPGTVYDDATGDFNKITLNKPTSWESVTYDNTLVALPETIQFTDEPLSKEQALELALATNDGTRTLEQVIAMQRAWGKPVFKDWVYEDKLGNSTLQCNVRGTSDLLGPSQLSMYNPVNKEMMEAEVQNQQADLQALLPQDKLDLIKVWLEDYYKINMTETSITFANGVTRDLTWTGRNYRATFYREKNNDITRLNPGSFDLKFERYPDIFSDSDGGYSAKWNEQERQALNLMLQANKEIKWVAGLGFVPRALDVEQILP